jgi:hypothetical protein
VADDSMALLETLRKMSADGDVDLLREGVRSRTSITDLSVRSRRLTCSVIGAERWLAVAVDALDRSLMNAGGATTESGFRQQPRA